MFIPWPVYIWLLISSAAVTYDFFYIYLRPLSFRYNPYEWTFEPYQVYQFFDTLKINMEDRYLVIQSWLNMVEVGLLLLVFVISLLPFRKIKFFSAISVIVFSSFVFWKTVFYLTYDRHFVTPALKNFYSIAVVFYYFTIGQFIICPLLTIFGISRRICKYAVEGTEAKAQQKKTNQGKVKNS